MNHSINRSSRYALAAVVALAAGVAKAADYYTSVPFLPTVNINNQGEGATPVDKVYGKEYSQTNPLSLGPLDDPRIRSVDDHRADGTLDNMQVVLWDGIAGPIFSNSGSVDGFDYSNNAGNFQLPDAGQIDALANSMDLLLKQVTRNEASLLFSVTSDVGNPGAHVHFEAPVGPTMPNGHGVWATLEALGVGVNHHGVADLDALEVWGPEPPSHTDRDTEVSEGYVGGGPGVGVPVGDANRFSLDNDAALGESVLAYDAATGAVMPWIPHMAIVDAVEELFVKQVYGPGARFDDGTRRLIDVDATMARDLPGDVGAAPGFNLGDELLFSIDPIDAATIIVNPQDPQNSTIMVNGLIDGGEIMHLVKTSNLMGPGTFTINFLNHGGHLWNTAFPVAQTFGYEFEDVDALEAVGVEEGTPIDTPEPNAWLLVLAAAPLLGARRRG